MIMELIMAGLGSLKEYVVAHVVTCLIPAFLLAGGIVQFVNRDAIIDYLGERANKARSFSLAAFSSFFLAACSCTVIPVAGGLYAGGAGIGVAFIVLWVAPSANILSLIYTGSVIGSHIVAARVVAALAMALVVGLVMSVFFAREHGPVAGGQETKAHVRIVSREHLVLLLLVLASLLLPNYLVQTGEYWRKVIVWALVSAVMLFYAGRVIARDDLKGWLRESYYFVRIIFPLLLVGVFVVGIVGKLLPEEWVRSYLGGNGLLACFLATMIGSVSYFATMTEAPFVHTLMNMGMGPGPALALLLTGPGLSLPNWIAIARVFGTAKAVVYVLTIIVLGTTVGWFFGNVV